MIKYFTFLILSLLIALSACESNLEIDFPPHQPLFSILGSLEAGVPVDIIITKSKGILENSHFPTVKDAIVSIIEEGEKSYPLYYFEREYFGVDAGGYTSDDLVIEAGKTYELIVSGENMLTATSKVTIPRPVKIKSYSRADHEIMHHSNSQLIEFSLEFEDPEDINFYEISIHINYLTSSMSPMSGPISIIPTNPLHFREPAYYSQSYILINDAGFNGQTVKIGFFTANVEIEKFFSNNYYDFHLELKHVTEDYYKYQTTSELQRKSQTDPLAQSVQVHSNVKNGLGTLKAGTATRMRVE